MKTTAQTVPSKVKSSSLNSTSFWVVWVIELHLDKKISLLTFRAVTVQSLWLLERKLSEDCSDCRYAFARRAWIKCMWIFFLPPLQWTARETQRYREVSLHAHVRLLLNWTSSVVVQSPQGEALVLFSLGVCRSAYSWFFESFTRDTYDSPVCCEHRGRETSNMLLQK